MPLPRFPPITLPAPGWPITLSGALNRITPSPWLGAGISVAGSTPM